MNSENISRNFMKINQSLEKICNFVLKYRPVNSEALFMGAHARAYIKFFITKVIMPNNRDLPKKNLIHNYIIWSIFSPIFGEI